LSRNETKRPRYPAFNHSRGPKLERFDYYLNLRGLRFSHSTIIGLATNQDEYVPTSTPKNIARAKSRITCPPKIKIDKIASRVVEEVIVVRESTSLIDILTVLAKSPRLAELFKILADSVEDDHRVG
jgi:hypothetical protein